MSTVVIYMNRITGLTLKRHWLAQLPWVPKLFVPSIALEQIEAAVLI
jgi:hypothetical protein